MAQGAIECPRLPVRIGLLIGSLEFGGAQRMLLALAEGLAALGYDVTVIICDDVRDMTLPVTEAGKGFVDLNVVALSGARGQIGTVSKLSRFPRQYFALKRLEGRLDFSLVISFMERANILSLLLGRGRARVISVRKHIVMALGQKSLLKRKLVSLGYRYIVARANRVVFNSLESADAFRGMFRRQCPSAEVIYNSVDADSLARLSMLSPACEDAVPMGNAAIVSVGRLTAVKGFVPLIRAFRVVRQCFPRADLIIVGSGPCRAQLEQLAASCGLADSVQFLGALENPYPVMRRADVFVSSSRAEGFPNVLLEALALGRAVVAADCPSGPREILAPDTEPHVKCSSVELVRYGILTPPMPSLDLAVDEPMTAGESGLVEGILMVLRDPGLQESLGAAGLARAADFGPGAIACDWDRLIREVLAG